MEQLALRNTLKQYKKRFLLVYKGARLVSYDDVAEEEEGEGDKEKVNKYMYNVSANTFS